MMKLQLAFVKMGRTIHVSGFPYLIAAADVKKFLEGYTGEGTVEALEVKQLKHGSRAYARVQFINSRCTEIMIDRANTRLNYGISYLKVYEQKTDIAPNRRTFEHEMNSITLNFGCQISKHEFSVLWKAANVSVKFGTGMKKMHFYLSHHEVEYRLQLSYENIWQIVLYNSSGQTTKILLVQVRLNFGCIFFVYGNEQLYVIAMASARVLESECRFFPALSCFIDLGSLRFHVALAPSIKNL